MYRLKSKWLESRKNLKKKKLEEKIPAQFLIKFYLGGFAKIEITLNKKM